MSDRLSFTVRSNPSTIVEVTTKAGKHYKIELQLGLMEIIELEPPPPPGVVSFQYKVAINSTITTIEP